jgi:hypothetical protein
MLLAITVLGFTFSGREALIAGVIVVVVIVAAWWVRPAASVRRALPEPVLTSITTGSSCRRVPSPGDRHPHGEAGSPRYRFDPGGAGYVTCRSAGTESSATAGEPGRVQEAPGR